MHSTFSRIRQCPMIVSKFITFCNHHRRRRRPVLQAMWQISKPSFENMQTQLPLRLNNSVNMIPITISMAFTRGDLDINTGVAVEVTGRSPRQPRSLARTLP